ncbi:MAG TPA: hypothetical protein PK614_06720 [Nitrospira sp.]|nr:hypothetical protein [Nitrospira sp.]
MAVSLLVVVQASALAQTENTSLRGITKRDNVPIDIKAGETKQVQIPLSTTSSGSLIRVRLISSTPSPNVKVKMSAGGKTLKLLRLFKSSNSWVFKANASATNAVIDIQSASTEPVQGKLLIAVVDSDERRKANASRAAAPKTQSVRKEVSPDVLMAVSHTLKRAASNFPGTKSTQEQAIAQAINQGKISRDILKTMSKALEKRKPQFAPRVQIAELSNLPPNRPVPKVALDKVLTVKKPLSLPHDDVGPAENSPIDPNAKYTIRIAAIQSQRCADDVGWETGCDDEEPFIAWFMVGADYLRTGVTDSAEIQKGQTHLFKRDTMVLSGAPDNSQAIRPSWPIAFDFQIIEDDPEGPTREQLNSALKTGAEIAALWYTGGLSGAVKDPEMMGDAVDLARYLIDSVQCLSGCGDDEFGAYKTVLSEQTAANLTNGKPLEIVSQGTWDWGGNYDKYHKGIVEDKTSNGKATNWKVMWEMTRR